MDFLNIFKAVFTLGMMGAVFAGILGVSSKIFAVEEDERLPLILDALPGANCGGCGFPGCSNFALAVIDGKAPPSGCPVGGADCAVKVSEIMGLDATAGVRQVACVSCSGGINAQKKFAYEGIEDCLAATKVLGGPVKCSYGCL
ncbi:MAG: (Fe-S)-binding protein, partial [Clostridia bacterium]